MKHSLREHEAKRTVPLCAEGTLHRAQPCFIFHAPQMRFILLPRGMLGRLHYVRTRLLLIGSRPCRQKVPGRGKKITNEERERYVTRGAPRERKVPRWGAEFRLRRIFARAAPCKRACRSSRGECGPDFCGRCPQKTRSDGGRRLQERKKHPGGVLLENVDITLRFLLPC